LLDNLATTDNIIVLYTGDSPGIVKKVFAATGLGKYFRFYFTGTEVATRADMVQQAINQVEKLTGRKFASKDIVIIGDSIRDIDCGKQFNALTIAVSTGFHSASELLSHEPDYLFSSLEDYWAIIKAISYKRKV
ncbi:HAD family hydrolase, partial [Chloroflexota bacterium]